MTSLSGRWIGMNTRLVRVLGVIATVVVVVTVGMAVARAAQPPDASEIPVVQTSRPVSQTATDTLDAVFGSDNSASATIRPQAEPAQETNSGFNPAPDSNWGTGSESNAGASSSSRGGDVVVPPVRDEEHEHEEEKEEEEEKKEERKSDMKAQKKDKNKPVKAEQNENR